MEPKEPVTQGDNAPARVRLRLAESRGPALLLGGIGLLFVLAPVAALYGLERSGPGRFEGWPLYALAIVGPALVLYGLFQLLMAGALARPGAGIELQGDGLRRIHGLWGRSPRRPVGELTGVGVVGWSRPRPAHFGTYLEHMAELRVEFQDAPAFVVGPADQEDVLELERRLRAELARRGRPELALPTPPARHPAPPNGCFEPVQIARGEYAAGLTRRELPGSLELHVERVSRDERASCLLAFLATAAVLAGPPVALAGGWPDPLSLLVFAPAALIAGFLALVLAERWKRRDGAHFRIDSDGLDIAVIRPLRVRRSRFSRAILDDVRSGARVERGDGPPELELQIHARGAKALGLLAGRRPEELEWIAAELWRALGLPARPSEPPEPSC